RSRRRPTPRREFSACGRFPWRQARRDSAGLPPATRWHWHSLRNYIRIDRSPAVPLQPSCGAAAGGLGELHPLSEGQGLIVPGGAVVFRHLWRCSRGKSGRKRRALLRGKDSAVLRTGRQKACEKSIQPGALLGRKRRIFRNHGGGLRRPVNGVHASCPSAKALSAPTSWRAEKS